MAQVRSPWALVGRSQSAPRTGTPDSHGAARAPPRFLVYPRVPLPPALQAAYIAYATQEAQNICAILNIQPEPGVLAKVAKFIRSNGHLDITDAAHETRRTMNTAQGAQQPATIADPWAYTVQVANGRWARARELYLRLGLYEHALRCRVQELVGAYLGADWWQNPALYMRQQEANNMLRTNPSIRRRPPAGPGDIPPMQPFPTATAFVEKLDLGELHAIVLKLWNPIFRHIFNPFGQPLLTFDKAVTMCHRLVRARHDVMHMRSIPKSAFPILCGDVERLLAAMEFDTAKALANIRSAAT